MRHFPYNCLGLSDEDNSVSRTDNFVNVNVFNSVTYPRVLSYHCVLRYFLTIPVGFNFNLTFGLKPQVGSIKKKIQASLFVTLGTLDSYADTNTLISEIKKAS